MKQTQVWMLKIIRIGKSAAKLRIEEGSTTIGWNTIKDKCPETGTA